MLVNPIGNPGSKFYIITLHPTESDIKNKVILSDSEGYELSKWQLPANAFYTYIFNTTDLKTLSDAEINDQIQDFITKLKQYKPTIILALGNKAFQILCPQYLTKKKYNIKKTEALKSSLLSYYSGSLCISSLLDYEHFVIPTLSVSDVWKQWDRRDEVISIDVARAVEEYNYFRQNNKLQPLPAYNLIVDPDFNTLIDYLDQLCALDFSVPISVDIETLRPKKTTEIFKNHPGFPYTIALAPSETEAISFCFWSYDSLQLVSIFKKLEQIFTSKKIIGQNFFSFDLNMLEAAFGFSFNLANIIDTKLRHHILWPELPHKLQFLTKQYTRQIYYKDEGKNFSPRNKSKLIELLHYGALDVVVTYKVYLEQEKEFADRPWLK